MAESGPKYIPHHFSILHRVKGFASGYLGAGLGMFMYDRMFNQDLGAFQTPAANIAAVAVGVLSTFFSPAAARRIYAHVQFAKLQNLDAQINERRAGIVRHVDNDPVSRKLSREAEELSVKLENEGLLPMSDFIAKSIIEISDKGNEE
jgi:hypothetical protein